MTIHTFPCGGVSVIGKEPRGEQPIGMAEWEDHMTICQSMTCALAADQAKLESMGAFESKACPDMECIHSDDGQGPCPVAQKNPADSNTAQEESSPSLCGDADDAARKGGA